MGVLATVIDTVTGDFEEIVQTVEAHYGENKYCDQFAPSGEDAPPLKDDLVALVEVEGTGNMASVGVLAKSLGAKPGEKIIYGRDANGNVTSKIYLHNDGTISIETEKPITFDGEKITIQGGGAAAARVDDTVEVEIPAQTVVVAVSGGSGAPAVGTMNIQPIKLQGKITSGSKTVEIG